ncbi:MAG: multicatalytic endopeptidase, partial [Watsoniomyces obsoletus]
MGLMLGEFVDDFTVRVVDVFAMPQSGTSVSVESVDPVFQTKMMDMLRQTGRPETVVGWYHSHPGFGCWLSSVDINTQQSFEQLTPRAVAVVVERYLGPATLSRHNVLEKISHGRHSATAGSAQARGEVTEGPGCRSIIELLAVRGAPAAPSNRR